MSHSPTPRASFLDEIRQCNEGCPPQAIDACLDRISRDSPLKRSEIKQFVSMLRELLEAGNVAGAERLADKVLPADPGEALSAPVHTRLLLILSSVYWLGSGAYLWIVAPGVAGYLVVVALALLVLAAAIGSIVQAVGGQRGIGYANTMIWIVFEFFMYVTIPLFGLVVALKYLRRGPMDAVRCSWVTSVGGSGVAAVKVGETDLSFCLGGLARPIGLFYFSVTLAIHLAVVGGIVNGIVS